VHPELQTSYKISEKLNVANDKTVYAWKKMFHEKILNLKYCGAVVLNPLFDLVFPPIKEPKYSSKPSYNISTPFLPSMCIPSKACLLDDW
jgi:hypothetical protein